MTVERHRQSDFETAMGEEFAAAVCPPAPFDLASPHECCEAAREVLGPDVTPARLSSLSDQELTRLAVGFGRYFETEAPSVEKLRKAVTRILWRWPASD